MRCAGLDRPAKTGAGSAGERLALYVALLLAGLQFSLPLMYAQRASHPPAQAKLLVGGSAEFRLTQFCASSAPAWPADVPQTPRGGNPPSPSEAKIHYEKAQKLLREGNLDGALAEVQAGLKAAPRSVQGLVLLGSIYTRKGDLAQAVAAYEQALRLDPRSTPAHNNLGSIYFTEKKSDLAEKEFRETLRYDPSDSDANYNLGSLLLARNDARQAIVYLRRVQPPTPEALFHVAQAYFATGEKAKALELVKSLSEKAGNDVPTHFTLGVLLAGQKQYAEAIHEFEAANALKPDTPEILHDLGQAYLKSGDNEKAKRVLDRALKVSPDSVETLYLMAQAYSNAGSDVDALEFLVKAHKLAPRNTDVTFLMAHLSMKQSYYEDAIPLLEEGLKIDPNRPKLLAALGECYFMMGRTEKAKEIFQTLVQVEPSAHSYAFMGVCYRRQGQFDEAEKYFRLGLKADPRDPSCLYNLGYVETRQGHYDAGEKWLKQALEVDSNFYEALLELGNLKMHQKEFAEAVTVLRKCVQLNPHPAPVYYRLATAERNLHQMEAAERDMKIFQTLSRDPAREPYPFAHLYDYLDERARLAPRQQTQVDLAELEYEVKIYPAVPRTFYLLAEVYLKLGRVDDAKAAIAQLDQLSQGDFRTMVGVGVLLARYRLYPEAIARFQKALESNPDSDDAWYDLADAYFRKRDYSQALTAAQHVSPQGQKDSSYLALLADIDARLGQTAEAIKLFRQEIAENPDQDQAYLSLALVYLRSGNTPRARQTLLQGLARAPDAGELLWGMGVVSVMEGQAEEAEQYLERSVDLLPEWPGSYSALGVLYYQTGQIDKARKTLERFKQSGVRGGLDVQRIEQALAATPESSGSQRVQALTPEARQQFFQVALAFADQSP
jgi:tetratricopeptide (TPR) repeat protein